MKSTHTSFCIAFVCGSPGSGKSFCMTRDVIDRLTEDDQVRIVTNLPLNMAEVSQLVASKRGCEVSAVLDRVRLIDRDVLRRWADGQGGPWDFAAAGEAQGWELLLDECHIYCSKKQKARHIFWEKWLGEARHEGWRRIVFITQDVSKVGPPIVDHSELRFELTNSERRRDPILQIPMGFWYEVIASFTREYRSSIAVTEYRRINGKLRAQHTDRVPLDPFWFRFYNSYEAAGGGTGRGHGSTASKREFEKRPIFVPARKDGKLWLPTWLWFLKRFFFRFAMAGAVLVAFVWLVPMQGSSSLLRGWIDGLTKSAGVGESADGVEPGATPDNQKAEAPPPRKPIKEVLAGLNEEDREAVQHELQLAAREVRQKLKRVEEIEREREAERRLQSVVAVTEDEVWFTNPPCSCKLGRRMEEGPYRGKLVRKIDVQEGWCELDGGIRLWIGRGSPQWVPGAEPEDGKAHTAAAGDKRKRNAARAGEVPGAVQAPSAGAESPELADPRESADNDLGSRDDATGLRPQDRLRSVLVRRDVAGHGRQALDARSEGSAD